MLLRWRVYCVRDRFRKLYQVHAAVSDRDRPIWAKRREAGDPMEENNKKP